MKREIKKIKKRDTIYFHFDYIYFYLLKIMFEFNIFFVWEERLRWRWDDVIYDMGCTHFILKTENILTVRFICCKISVDKLL